MPVIKGNVGLVVDPSLEKIRPVIMGAIVRDVNTGSNREEKDDFIQSLMDHQEKLHLTLGRKRRFSSIGVHDLSSLKPPFKVTTVPSSYTFIPLACEDKMSIEEILEAHPKGKEYGHLMEGMQEFPVIQDSDDKVLSFPPIINGSHTTVNEHTRDFFIDVTGWDVRSCEACLQLICLSMTERGGTVESVEVTGFDGSKEIQPRGDAKVHKIPEKLIHKILGLKLTNEELSKSIDRMGGLLLESRTVTDGPNEYGRWVDCVVGDTEHLISMPRWRSDIMHPIDVVEDIAIGFGFENLPQRLSKMHIDASPLESSHLKRRFGESMRACGLQEVQTLTLSSENDQFENLRWPQREDVVKISNPITSEHTILRQFILPSLLRLLAANRHHELPQRVYELGEVVRGSKNAIRGAWICAEVGSGFTSAKGIVQAFLRDMGINTNDVEFRPTPNNHGPWIRGRGGQIFFRENKMGEFGEIDPKISSIFGIKSPIQAGELDLEVVSDLLPDPIN